MKKTLYVLALGLFLFGCAGIDELKPERTVEDLYKEAYEEFDDKHYEEAAELFKQVEAQFPSSSWAADSLIMMAYSRYVDKDYAGAILTIDRFMRFHPGHEDVSYMLYLRGMCYYNQVSDVRREPGMSVYALQQFQQLVERFPKSKYAKSANNKILILKNYIAGKVMYSARNAMKKENWTTAINNLQTIVTGAQETVMTPEALYRLTEAYTAIGLTEQAKGYGDMLKLNFPDNEWTEKLE